MSRTDKWLLFLGVLNSVLAIANIAIEGDGWVIALGLISSMVCVFAVYKM